MRAVTAAGRFAHYGDLEKDFGNQRSDVGQVEDNWSVIAAAVPVMIKKLSGNEVEFAEAMAPTSTHEVRCRYFAEVTTAMRWNIRGKRYNILAVEDVDLRNREVICLCGIIDGTT